MSTMLWCLGKHETSMVLAKVHKGVCINHIGEKAIAHKFLREGYYWHTLMKDNIAFIKKCNQFQRHANLHHSQLSFFSPWWHHSLYTSEGGHFRSIPPSTRPTKIVDSESRLLHKMDKGKSCLQNHNRKRFPFLLTENYMHVQASKIHYL